VDGSLSCHQFCGTIFGLASARDGSPDCAEALFQVAEGGNLGSIPFAEEHVDGSVLTRRAIGEYSKRRNKEQRP
jgi:hypothetical protein